MTPEQIAAILAAIGAGSIITKLIEATWKWLSGRIGRERSAITVERNRASTADENAERERTRATAEQDRADSLDRKLDLETRRRREVTEYAAKLRRDAIDRGISPSELPEWPVSALE